jgi:REP element-mobilizing transposase RayT
MGLATHSALPLIFDLEKNPEGNHVPVRLFAHAVWTTFARLPLIDDSVAAFLRHFVVAEANRHGARVVELGIVRDHVHVVVELPATFDVPRLMQGLKGASARIANRDGIAAHESLRWAQGYDLRSIGVGQLRRVIAYVQGQNGRHPERALSVPSFRTNHQAEPGLQPTDNETVEPPAEPGLHSTDNETVEHRCRSVP